MINAFSIRQSLQGSIHDFSGESNVFCARTENLIRDLVCLLASYREEGVSLYPSVYITLRENVIPSIAPGAERISLGNTKLDDGAAEIILKKTANLARGNWSVFVEKVGDDLPEVHFGIFQTLRHSFSISAEESLKGLGNEMPVILVKSLGHSVVELKNSMGNIYTVSLTAAHASSSLLMSHVNEFAKSLISDIESNDKEIFLPYASRFLTEVVQKCHGTLMATVRNRHLTEPHETLRDGVWIKPSTNWFDKHGQAYAQRDADSLSSLQSTEHLIEGIVNNDGLVVFGTNGSVLAFRVFLSPNEQERGEVPELGGGRRRTFELMRLRLNGVFDSVFFRSQDGETNCGKASR